jgi:hypothetical protein
MRLAAPDLLLEIVSRHNFSCAIRQHGEHFERLWLEFDASAGTAKFAGAKVHFKGAEPDQRRAVRRHGGIIPT